jgi:peptide/nickel transport system substrate-binding protein
MNKEPIGLYIFRFILGFGLFAFMCMLYWSSIIIEDQLQSLRSDVSQINNDLLLLKADNEKIRSDILLAIDKQQDRLIELFCRGGLCASKAADLSIPDLEANTKKSSEADREKYPNLLSEDPFFLKTLPKLLGKDFVPRWTQHTAVVGKPDNLHPFTNWSQVAAWHDRCNVSAAKSEFGKYETFAQDMALRIEERINEKTQAPEFWVFLRDNVFWQPLQQQFFGSDVYLAPQFLRKNKVTSEDYKFFYDAMMNPFVQEPGAVSLRTYYAALEEIEVVDPLTFIVRWKTDMINGVPKIKYMAKQMTGALRPLASFVYKYFMDGKKIIENDDQSTYRTNSVWAQNFAQHWAKNVIVSCGAWVFDGMTDRQISFKRNLDFYDPVAALTEGIETEFKESPDNIWQEFKNNRLDSYSLQPNQLSEFKTFLESDAYKQQAAKGAAIKRLDFVSRSYTYIGWNEAKPFFANAKVRRALTMAIDRKRIIRENLNGLGIEINGTFYRYSPAYDASIEPWQYNPQQARRMLEEEGWYDSDGDGIIDKPINGKSTPFRFSLTYFVKNPLSKSVAEYIATAMKEIGIDVHLNGVDIADLSALFDDKEFDAVLLGWALGTPPEDPRQIWHSSGAKEKGSSNAVGFVNSEVDKIIEQLDYEYDEKKRTALYHQFDKIIHEEQPYTFLYTPKTAFLYREYLKNVFIPADRQDLVPGANVAEPDPNIFWLNRNTGHR